MAAPTAQGDAITWTGGSDTDFEAAGNWSGTTTPPTDDTATDTAVLASGASNTTPTLTTSRSVAGVLFDASGYDLGNTAGEILTVGSGGIDANQTGTVSTDVAVGASGNWTVAAGENLYLNGVISGSAGNDITFDGDGSARLQNANTFAGKITWNAGWLFVATDGTGTGVLELAGGRISKNGAGNKSLSNSSVILSGDMLMGHYGSSFRNNLAFGGQVTLTGGDHTLTLISTNGTNANTFSFSDGVTEDVSGRSLIVAGGSGSSIDPYLPGRNSSLSLGGTSNFTGQLIINSSNVVMNGTSGSNGMLTSASGVVVEKNGSFGLLDYQNNTPDSVADTIPIYLYGGQITNAGTRSSPNPSSTVDSQETFGTVTVGPGDATIHSNVKRGVGEMTVTSLVRDRGTVTFEDDRFSSSINHAMGGSGAGHDHVYLIGQSAGFIAGWAIFNADADNASGFYDFASYDVTYGVEELGDTVVRINQIWNSASTAHVRTDGALIPPTMDETIASLVVNDQYDLDLDGNTLNVTSGGVLKWGNTTWTVSDSSGGGGVTSTGGELIITIIDNTTTFNVPILAASPVTLTKSGAGILILTEANTATGDLTVNNGTLQLDSTGAWDGTVTVAADARLIINDSGALSDAATIDLDLGGLLFGVLELNQDLTVAGLYLDGVSLDPGTYGGSDSGADNIYADYFDGTGVLTVTGVVPEPATLALLAAGSLGISVLRLRRRRNRRF